MTALKRTFQQFDGGAWHEQLVSDNGSRMTIECRTHKCKAPELLGPFHFHGEFIAKDDTRETFFGREGGDYPTHLMAALELEA